MFTTITEFPLPLSEDELTEFIDSLPDEMANRHPDHEDIHIDEFYDKNVNEISKSQSWLVFELFLPFNESTYVWNTEIGTGFAFSGGIFEFGDLAQAISLARQSDWRKSTPPVEPETDGCPFCDEGDTLSTSLSAGCGTEQRCNSCGRSELI